MSPGIVANRLLRRVALTGVARRSPRIVRILPHDPEAHTQGLLYAREALYESTGLVGHSSLRRLDADKGHVLQKVHVSGRFAEGIALCGGKLFQIAEDSDEVLIFDPIDLDRPPHRIRGMRGWGLTSHGEELIMSNGSSELRVLDTAFRTLRVIRVRSNGLPARGLNEIEWARNAIFANVWYSHEILRISPTSGRVERVIDCREIVAAAAPSNPHHILNGIAYRETSDRFLLGGKRWDRIFEVEIPD